MKHWLVALALLAAALSAVILLRREAPLPPPPAAARLHDPAVAAPLRTADARAVAVFDSNFTALQPTAAPRAETALKTPVPAGPPVVLQFSELPPPTVLENVRTAIRGYGSMFGGNPVGTNEEITRALNGDNPRQTKFIGTESGLRLNAKGELIDPWSTPYFFHQLSGTETEVRSAGPDGVMWTADDLVIK